MAATGKTPILLYGSTTATNQPSAGNLTNSSDGCEIAINVADKNLFFKDATNTINTVPIRQSSASSNGWLSSTDWSTFNSKQPAGSYLTSVTVDSPLTGAGTSASHLSIPAASGSTNGYLTSTDWTTFNGKAPAFTYTTGYIPFGQGTTTPTQSANLFWDNSNNRLGVNTSSPTKAFDNRGELVSGNGTFQTGISWAAGGLIGTFSNHSLGLMTNSTQVGVLDTSGNLSLTYGNLVIGTSGKGIDFSATAGTGTSELLADYEEGTWTPAILTYGGGASDPTFTGLVVSGRYTKIGRQVTATGRMYWTGRTGGAALVAIQGLPYTVASEDGFMGVMKYNSTYQAGTGVAYTIYAQNLMPRFYQAGYDRIKFGYAMSGNITGDLAVGDLINSTQYFEFSVTYFN